MKRAPTPALIFAITKLLRAAYGRKIQGSPKQPLDSLIETILSQNTSDKNSIPAFHSLKDKFKTWEAVRTANIPAIERTIRSAGLFRIKAGRIKKVLNTIKDRTGKTDLNLLKKADANDAEEFLSGLDGVGPKTMACVMLFALKKPYFPVDTHILRIGKRLGLLNSSMNAEKAHDIFQDMVPHAMMYELHLNMIEHGRKTCHARNPECGRCPLRKLCRWPALSGRTL
jgi:endonuclease-3